MSALLEVEELTARFDTSAGPVRAVNEVSFTVDEGEVVGIVGESGSGKSATVRALLGLVRPPGVVSGGTVRLGGRDLRAMSRRDLRCVRGAQIGFVGQNPFGSLNPILRIGHQFHNVIRAHESTTKERSRARARAVLASVGIADPERVLDGYAHQLSGGMAQRVVIGLALVLDPQLVIADEPTTALDVTVQRQTLDLIRDNIAKGGRSMLLVTHDLGVVAHYCQRVVVMYAGRVVETGPVRQVFGEPAHPYTLALLEAVPRAGKPLRSLPGRVPSLVDYPTGCPFSERCRFAFERCEDELPVLAPTAAGRRASCHLTTGEEAHSLVSRLP